MREICPTSIGLMTRHAQEQQSDCLSLQFQFLAIHLMELPRSSAAWETLTPLGRRVVQLPGTGPEGILEVGGHVPAAVPRVMLGRGSTCSCLPAGSTPGRPVGGHGGGKKVSGPAAILGSRGHRPEWHSALLSSISTHGSGGRGGPWVQTPIAPLNHLAR